MAAAHCQISEVLAPLPTPSPRRKGPVQMRNGRPSHTHGRAHVHTCTREHAVEREDEKWFRRLRATGRNCIYASAMQPHAIAHKLVELTADVSTTTLGRRRYHSCDFFADSLTCRDTCNPLQEEKFAGICGGENLRRSSCTCVRDPSSPIFSFAVLIRPKMDTFSDMIHHER